MSPKDSQTQNMSSRPAAVFSLEKSLDRGDCNLIKRLIDPLVLNGL